MATGKTNAKHIRVKLDDSVPTLRDISAGVAQVSGVGLTYAEQDVTAYSDGIINFTLGFPSSDIELSGPIDNLATTGSYTVLKSIVGLQTATYTLEVQFGIRAAPATGDPNFSGEYYCSSLKLNGDGTFSARLVPASATAPTFGTVA